MENFAIFNELFTAGLVHVFTFLRPSERLSVRHVCRAWSQTALSPALWRKLKVPMLLCDGHSRKPSSAKRAVAPCSGLSRAAALTLEAMCVLPLREVYSLDLSLFAVRNDHALVWWANACSRVRYLDLSNWLDLSRAALMVLLRTCPRLQTLVLDERVVSKFNEADNINHSSRQLIEALRMLCPKFVCLMLKYPEPPPCVRSKTSCRATHTCRPDIIKYRSIRVTKIEEGRAPRSKMFQLQNSSSDTDFTFHKPSLRWPNGGIQKSACDSGMSNPSSCCSSESVSCRSSNSDRSGRRRREQHWPVGAN